MVTWGFCLSSSGPAPSASHSRAPDRSPQGPALLGPGTWAGLGEAACVLAASSGWAWPWVPPVCPLLGAAPPLLPIQGPSGPCQACPLPSGGTSTSQVPSWPMGRAGGRGAQNSRVRNQSPEVPAPGWPACQGAQGQCHAPWGPGSPPHTRSGVPTSALVRAPTRRGPPPKCPPVARGLGSREQRGNAFSPSDETSEFSL